MVRGETDGELVGDTEAAVAAEARGCVERSGEKVCAEVAGRDGTGGRSRGDPLPPSLPLAEGVCTMGESELAARAGAADPKV